MRKVCAPHVAMRSWLLLAFARLGMAHGSVMSGAWRSAAIGCSMDLRRSARGRPTPPTASRPRLSPPTASRAALCASTSISERRRLRVRAPRAAARSAGELTRSRSSCAAKAPINNFEVKLADASGENVWWFERRDFEFPSEWRRIKIKKRQIAFAWGPTQDRALRHTDSLEFVVARRPRRRQRLDRDRRSELPRAAARRRPTSRRSSATASSSLSGAEPAPRWTETRAPLAQRPQGRSRRRA